MLQFIARFVAVVCVLMFIFVTVPIVFLHAGGTRIARAQMYKDALVKEEFYARFPEVVADNITQAARSATGEGQAAFALVRDLTRTDWETVFGFLAPPAYLRTELEGLLDRFFGFLHSDATSLSIEISFVEIKRRVAGPEAEEAYAQLLAGKPVCNDQQMNAAEGLPIVCRPDPALMPRVWENFRGVMRAVAGEMPDTLSPFGKMTTGENRTAESLAGIRPYVRLIEKISRWSIAVPAVLLGLILVFGIRSFRGLLLWWGLPCLFAGAFIVMLALPGVPMARWVFSTFVRPNLPAESPAVTIQAMFEIFTAAVQEVMSAALQFGGIMVASGAIAVVLLILFKPRPRAVRPPIPPAVPQAH